MKFFELGEPISVTLKAEGKGRILVHGLPLDTASMTIDFFKGFPVTVSAEGVGGGIFTGWSDGVADATRTILPEEIDALTANFK